MQNQIPKNWQVTTLGGTAILNYGKSLPEQNRHSGDVPVYGSSGVAGYHNEPLVNEPGYIIGRKGTVGALHYSQQPFFPIDTTYYITRSDINCDFGFFKYLLKTLRLNQLNSDSAVPGLNRDTAYAQTVLLPTLLEQKRIASILSAFDDKIEVNNKIEKTLEEMTQAIFKEWFSDDHGKEYSIYDLARYVNGGAFGKIVNHRKKGLPLAKIAELNSGIRDRTEWIDQKVNKKYYIKNGDLLFSWSGSLNIFIWDKGKAIFNQHIFNVEPKEGFSKGLLYFVLKSRLRYFQHLAGAKATTMGHIKKDHLKEQTVSIPKNANLKVFETTYQKLVQLKLENQKLAAMRNLLLPKLMRGEVRI